MTYPGEEATWSLHSYRDKMTKEPAFGVRMANFSFETEKINHYTHVFTLFLISLALWAKFSVDRVSPKHLGPGWTLATMAVLALPPRESCLTRTVHIFREKNHKIIFKQRKCALWHQGWEIIQQTVFVSMSTERAQRATVPGGGRSAWSPGSTRVSACRYPRRQGR